MKNKNWWSIAKSGQGFQIEWTPDTITIDGFISHGAVRARITDSTAWEYTECQKPSMATPLGLRIIDRLMRA